MPRSRPLPPYLFHIDPRCTFHVWIRATQWIPDSRSETSSRPELHDRFRFATMAEDFLLFPQLPFPEFSTKPYRWLP